MGVTQSLKDLLKTALGLHSELSVMSTKYAHLEKEFERLTDLQEKFVGRSEQKQQDLLERVAKLEATIDATFRSSIKEAAFQLAREQMAGNYGDAVSTTDLVTESIALVLENSEGQEEGNGRPKQAKEPENKTRPKTTPK